MLVTVFCAPRDRPETTFALDVSPELELRDFVALCELESGIPAGEIQILYIEQPLKDLTRALGHYGMKDGDVVVLRQADRRPPPTQPAFPGLPHIDFRSITVPGTSSSTSQHAAPRQQPPPPSQQLPQQLQAPLPAAQQPPTPMTSRGSNSSLQGLDDPALLQQMLLSNPHELSLLKERNPPLAEALLSGDLDRFTKVLQEQQQDRARREQERIRLLTADPFDLDAQAKIEEDIRQHNVEENMTIAMEEAPESFGQVVMLYINCRVNGHPVKAFVDSGAQMTIMSQACAERCNIMRLVDRRWAGIAKGVGTQKIIGRVHLAQVQIEGDFLPCSFSILEDQPMDMLLGLDMLKRHQCSIDLKKGVLLIGTTGTETRFLPEAELPECARLAYGPEGRGDPRPDEMADRELAEALQRSIQESDTADGQTTSPKPQPFPLPTSLDQMSPFISSSQSSSLADSQTLTPGGPCSTSGCSQQAPTPERCRDQPRLQAPSGLLGSLVEGTAASDLQADTEDLPPDAKPTLSPSFTGDLSEPSSHGDLPVRKALTIEQPEVGAVPPQAIAMDSESEGMSLCPGELSASQPMDQESVGHSQAVTSQTPLTSPSLLRQNEEERGDSRPLPEPLSLSLVSCPSDTDVPGDSSCAEMGSPCGVEGAVPSERVQPEGENCPVADSTPSLAAALLELHQLLVSNGCAGTHDRDASYSPTQPYRQNADGLDDSPQPRNPAPDNTPPLPNPFAALEPCGGEQSDDAKARHAATVPEEGDCECLVPGPPHKEECVFGDGAQAADGSGAALRSDSSWESVADGREEADTNDASFPEPEVAPGPPADLEFREPPEGQQGRGVADGRASGTCTPDSLGPLSEPPLQSPIAVGSPEEAPAVARVSLAPQSTPPAPSLSTPHLSTQPFPAEHIQRIRAAGFSAREAAEALEQAHGVVELALLALLARNITVPI